MRKIMFIVLVIFMFILGSSAKEETEMVEISGIVTDFDNKPIEGADILLMNDQFEPVYQTTSNTKGEYKLYVKIGTYLGLFACKDYKTKNLEYWAWNVPAYYDLEINPRIDGLEIYAGNAFMPQGALPSLFIYFRPMSLKRYKDISDKGGAEPRSIIEIAPDLSKDDIELKINDEQIDILELNKIREVTGKDQSMIGFLIQSALPKNWIKSEYLRICITLRDAETTERGEACLFWKE